MVKQNMPRRHPLTGRAALLATLTEKQWQKQVEEWARRGGWRVFHVYDMVRSAGGWPDLVLVKPGRRVIYAELKKYGGRVTDQQKAWLADLENAEGTDVYTWFPTDENEVRWTLLGDGEPLFAAGRSGAAEVTAETVVSSPSPDPASPRNGQRPQPGARPR